MTISPSGQGSVNGMYHVRVIHPATKEVVGFWPSIPINGGRRVASGIYYYRLEAAGFSETQKMLLLK